VSVVRDKRLQFTGLMLSGWLAVLTVGCNTMRSDAAPAHLPMFGQSADSQSDALQSQNSAFVDEALVRFHGNHQRASEVWSTAADEFMSEGKFMHAMRGYNNAWLLDPENYMPHWGFARVMLERDQLTEAAVHLEKASALCDDPYQKAALLTDRGAVYSLQALSDASEAEERRLFQARATRSFELATELDPAYANAWYRWSLALYREGQYLQAREKLQRAESLGASDLDEFRQLLESQVPAAI